MQRILKALRTWMTRADMTATATSLPILSGVEATLVAVQREGRQSSERVLAAVLNSSE
jgi:hypothetical protein